MEFELIVNSIAPVTVYELGVTGISIKLTSKMTVGKLEAACNKKLDAEYKKCCNFNGAEEFHIAMKSAVANHFQGKDKTALVLSEPVEPKSYVNFEFAQLRSY